MIIDIKHLMKLIFIIFLTAIFSCSFLVDEKEPVNEEAKPQKKDETCLIPLHAEFKTGAEQMASVTSILKGKNIGVVANPSSQIQQTHLVDTLLASGVNLKRIFCPEHGFRGEAAAGEKVDNSVDARTKLPIISLYGKHKKPTSKDLEGLDIIVFDIQDVGARFYTYISTLHYVMEAAAENNVEVLILDRPNPNGHCVDGPVLDPSYTSFIGMHEVPVLHGMTIGEYAQMINGEGWLDGALQCELTVISCLNYSRSMFYNLPVKPSPNLPNSTSVFLYPSLCFFEGTVVSVGRGTEMPFQVYGHPAVKGDCISFMPVSNSAAPNPKLKDKTCYGYTFSLKELESITCSGKLNLKPLLALHAMLENETEFFSRKDFFDLLAGTNELRQQIENKVDEESIRESWESGLVKFRKIRALYLLYP